MRLFAWDKSFREIFFSQLISILGGLIAGVFLAIYTDSILLIPGMFILIPGFLEMRGNISGAFSARLSSGLFLKIVKPYEYRTKIVKGNLFASFLLAVITSFVLGLVAFVLTFLLFKVVVIKLLFIPVIAGILANAVEIPLALVATFYLFSKGHDPNNIMGPFVTSTGDVVSVIALIIALVVL